MTYCENGGFAVLPDNPWVRSVFQLIGMEEDLGRGPNNRAGELIHQSHSPHQPPWLQTQPPRPYNSILVAMHNCSNWTFLIWFSFKAPSFSPSPFLHSFPWVWSSALIPICCCHSNVTPNSQSFIGVKLVSLRDFYHHKPNTAGWGSEAALRELSVEIYLMSGLLRGTLTVYFDTRASNWVVENERRGSKMLNCMKYAIQAKLW